MKTKKIEVKMPGLPKMPGGAVKAPMVKKAKKKK